MTKRFFIWSFWFFVASLLLNGFWRNDDGTLEMPIWWGLGGVAVLFGWWARFLSVKYPARSRLVYLTAASVYLLILIGNFAR